MNYELVKELKDAGFPFDFTESKMGDDTYTFPNLSELIDACGDGFSLYKRPKNKGWCAWLINTSPDMSEPHHELKEYGKTHKIAVARLWLAINKKP